MGALALSGSNLYAGGIFTTAGGSPATNVAKWDGTSWSALGSGININGGVSALAVSGSNVYAAANRYVEQWNGNSWSILGTMIGATNAVVGALAVSGSNVYAGGVFVAVDGVPATNIAKWDGTKWSALGLGTAPYGGEPYFSGGVSALAVSGGDLYAGGSFKTAGGSPATNIAKWDGSSWSALGSGMALQDQGGRASGVYALTVSGSDLYVGGSFTTAGGKVSAYVARAYLPSLPTLSVAQAGPVVTVSWPSADTSGFLLEQAHTLVLPASWVTNSANISDDGIAKSVTFPATNSPQFFRLRRP